MKILVSCIPYDRGKSGISVYTRNVITQLKEQGHDLTLLLEPGAKVFFPEYRCMETPGWTKSPVISMLYHLFVLPWQIHRCEYDFCIIAAANRRAFAWYRLFTIGVVHDLAQYHIPGKYSALRMIYLKHVLPFFVRRASALVAISRSTATDLERFWHVAPAKITICYNGVDTIPPARGHWCEKNDLKKKSYILYISRLEHPGKNHVSLIRAFAGLDQRFSDYKLVLAGSDWKDADIIKRTAAETQCADRIVFTGYLDCADLREAYQNAGMYIFPSFFEGFGLSLVEAMQLGVPCACSDNSSLGEIGEGAAELFPPDDIPAMRAAMEKVLGDVAHQRDLIERGYRRAAEFDWGKHVKELVQIYEKQNKR